MTENMKKFLEKLSEDKALSEKACKLEKNELIALAKELGLELTEVDFEQLGSEISEDELDMVAGAGDCICVAGGGGTKGDGDKVCCCILGGEGNHENGVQRCYCIVGGSGGGEGNSIR